MRRLSLFPIVAGLVGALYAVPALGISLDVVPFSTSVMPGDSFSIDVVVSELGGEVVSAFDLDLSYDSSVVDATGVTFGLYLGDPAAAVPEAFTDVVLSPGLVDFAEVSLLSDAQLLALQTGPAPFSFSLATISFDALTFGTSPLTLSDNVDVKGLLALRLDVDVGDGVVNVVPEPHAFVAFLVGALVVGGALRRKLF
jgi:hypothetical protein